MSKLAPIVKAFRDVLGKSKSRGPGGARRPNPWPRCPQCRHRVQPPLCAGGGCAPVCIICCPGRPICPPTRKGAEQGEDGGKFTFSAERAR